MEYQPRYSCGICFLQPHLRPRFPPLPIKYHDLRPFTGLKLQQIFSLRRNMFPNHRLDVAIEKIIKAKTKVHESQALVDSQPWLLLQLVYEFGLHLWRPYSLGYPRRMIWPYSYLKDGMLLFEILDRRIEEDAKRAIPSWTTKQRQEFLVLTDHMRYITLPIHFGVYVLVRQLLVDPVRWLFGCRRTSAR